MTPQVARLIHDTCLAMFITGSHVPPARLHTLKTSLHPDKAVLLQCQDPDCLHRGGCLGNRFEVVEGKDGGEMIKYVAPHHKTERRQGGRVLTYMVPEGPLSQLLLLHIKEGHQMLCESVGRDQPLLFMTRAGNGFDDVTFPQWWASFFDSQWGPPSDVTYFPPNKGRTLFVEHFMATTGNHPEDWEGAAYAMGNSVKQWREHYAPQMRDRLAQEAVNSHQHWRAVKGGSGDGDGTGKGGPNHKASPAVSPSSAGTSVPFHTPVKQQHGVPLTTMGTSMGPSSKTSTFAGAGALPSKRKAPEGGYDEWEGGVMAQAAKSKKLEAPAVEPESGDGEDGDEVVVVEREVEVIVISDDDE